MVTPLALNLNLCYNVSWVQRMRLISCAVMGYGGAAESPCVTRSGRDHRLGGCADAHLTGGDNRLHAQMAVRAACMK